MRSWTRRLSSSGRLICERDENQDAVTCNDFRRRVRLSATVLEMAGAKAVIEGIIPFERCTEDAD